MLYIYEYLYVMRTMDYCSMVLVVVVIVACADVTILPVLVKDSHSLIPSILVVTFWLLKSH